MMRTRQKRNRDDRPPRHLKDEDGMVLRDNIFGTPEEDALRRDFTINALAYNIADASVIDYSTGLSDLEQRLIRPIGDPAVRFTEDPVRMLRAVRFAASHDLVIEPVTWKILCALRFHHFPHGAGQALRRDAETLPARIRAAGFSPAGDQRAPGRPFPGTRAGG